MKDLAHAESAWRKTTQELAPLTHKPTQVGEYDLYPGFDVGSNRFGVGFDALAERLSGQHCIVIDGYVGVFWEEMRSRLDASLKRRGIEATWCDVANALKPAEAIDALIRPFLGGDDPIFGTRFTGTLTDFFDGDRLRELAVQGGDGVTIWYGCGASLVTEDAFCVYVDLPKNELQFRSRAGRVCNLGASEPNAPKPQYKRFYFVDWIALNRHKKAIIESVDVIVDGQRPDEPVCTSGDVFRSALDRMATNFFRVRPWFEPGVWGGQWCKEKIPGLPEAPNYAWSFELISPENGLLLESDGVQLEVSFDWLMYRDNAKVLGACAERFGDEFPIRFDFLDTVEGGNLSVQCHPRPDYIRREFGETFTQDETYYILDAVEGADVYLGFQDDIDPGAFRSALETSFNDATPVDIERFVQCHPSKKHDLFLIPHETIHGSGVGNLVLEISATPYIFTFKLYDWVRPDLDGKPRPLNIDRGFENLNFDRRGEAVRRELISVPREIERGDGWRLVHLPTHLDHFYDIHRYEFEREVEGETGDTCHVMSLVEGTSIILETENGLRQRFNYAETFVVPAAAGRYHLTNEGDAPAMVVKAFVKRGV